MIDMKTRQILATALAVGYLFSGAAIAQADSLYGAKIAERLVDDDRDGVINARDICPGTPTGAMVDNDGCHEKSSKLLSIELQILFDSGKYEVKPAYFPEVKKLADFLRSNPDSSVVIEGHTDDVGNDEYNLNLSQNRANAIAAVLVDSFKIRASRVKGVGYGETKPIADNSTAAGREQNRRVVAEVFARQTADVKRWTIYSVDKEKSLFSGR
ncbi:OmpA family protein [Maribrevibacterium harenarium]|uniref:OmpA family protein n=2 Tax=Maribrevibacterium harenarium TaxID=2589817 RepID=A0A501WMG6_9GAMM|nr:OmpA family protein [Maribrevibacterium harenarium]